MEFDEWLAKKDEEKAEADFKAAEARRAAAEERARKAARDEKAFLGFLAAQQRDRAFGQLQYLHPRRAQTAAEWAAIGRALAHVQLHLAIVGVAEPGADDTFLRWSKAKHVFDEVLHYPQSWRGRRACALFRAAAALIGHTGVHASFPFVGDAGGRAGGHGAQVFQGCAGVHDGAGSRQYHWRGGGGDIGCRLLDLNKRRQWWPSEGRIRAQVHTAAKAAAGETAASLHAASVRSSS